MNEQPIFQSGDVIVTSSQLVHGGNYYQLHSIKSVVFFKEPFDTKSFAINVICVLAALYGMSTFKSVCLIVGLIAVGICGFNLYNDYNDLKNPNYIVAVSFHSGESIYIRRRDLDWAQRLHDALHAAMRGM